MFTGRYYHTLEDKGRVSLPKKFREVGEKWVLTRGLDGGLFLYPPDLFETEVAKLNQLPFTKKAHRDFVRYLTNDALEIVTDKLGRILIPDHLRAAAQLVKEVVIVGSFQRIEVWSVERYHAYLDQLTQTAEELAESIEAP
jgi:MraZ protein